MKLINLVQLSLILTGFVSLYSMQKNEDKSFFVTIKNNSKHFAYVFYQAFTKIPHQDYMKETKQCVNLLPQETLNNLILSPKNPMCFIMINTKKGSFEISRRYFKDENKIDVFFMRPQRIESECKYMNCNIITQEIDSLNNCTSKQFVATVNVDGFVFVEAPAPKDGRPELSLAVYKKLVGQQIYATPQFILGLHSLNKDNPVTAYVKKSEEWRQKDDSDKNDVLKLLEWAAAKKYELSK